MSARRSGRNNARSRGQGLVEFSLVLIPFLWILMGIVDLGRGIYANNGVAEAARELARVTSVHTCDTTAASCILGTAPETAAVLSTQEAMIPGLGGAGSNVTYACTSITDATLSSTSCASGSFVRVTVTLPFQVLTPLLNMVAPATLGSTTHVQIP